MPHYLISWTEPRQRLYDITIRFTAPADRPQLLLPAWRPGRYILQNYAANVREWRGSHKVWKDGMTSWLVEARASEAVEVRYRYYAGILDGGSSFLDDDEAYVNPVNLCMLVAGLRDQEHLLTLEAPAQWRIETQMECVREQTFRASDYDHLVDSPIIAAERMTHNEFVEGGTTFHLIFRGDDGIDTAQYAEPFRKIARTQARFFDGFPFREYRFLYHVTDRWHGVEHAASCSVTVRRASVIGATPGSDGHDFMLTAASHELFHAWNVERIAPERFRPYEYWKETPTRLLWIVEGMTSYYGQLTLVRSGLWTPERYLADLQKEIETLEGMPARSFVSLSQLSFDSWLETNTYMNDYANATYSYYNKGHVVAALLDLTIRRVTNSAKSLDDVLRLMWEEYGKTGRGLEEDGFEPLVARVADVGDFFDRFVDGMDVLPYAEVFDAAGIELTEQWPQKASLATKFKTQDGLLIADSVIRGGAGMDAGLLPGDEIVSLAGTRVTTEAVLQSILNVMPMSATAELLITRAGMSKRLSVVARPDPRPQVRLKIAKDSELRRKWLRKDE